jgi:PqqD family protein of HPr-rel-A system
VQVVPEVIACPVEDELVLFNTTTGIYYGLNEIGAQIWQRVAEGATAEAIVAHLLATYEVDETTASSEVRRLLAELLQAGLLCQD